MRIPLIPLLVGQGLWVRKRSTRLPEPDGARQGRLGQGPVLRLLILGDSSAAGVGVQHQDAALSGQLQSLLAPHVDLSWHLLATTGFTTSDALQAVSELEAQPFDCAITVLGVNDVTSGVSKARFRRDQMALHHLLRSRFATHRIIASGVPPMQSFPLLPNPLAWVLGEQSKRLDSVLADLSQASSDVIHIPMSLPPDPALAAVDGYHPNARTYALWADVLARRLRHEMPT